MNVNLQAIGNKNLCDFVTKNTRKFFDVLDLSQEFLTEDPSTWAQNTTYIVAEETAKSLTVTNDMAEKGVALIQEYNGLTYLPWPRSPRRAAAAWYICRMPDNGHAKAINLEQQMTSDQKKHAK